MGSLSRQDDDEEEDEDEEDGSDAEGGEVEEAYPKLPQVDTILYRDGQPPHLPPSPQAQPPPPPLQAPFVPIQPLGDYSPADYPGGTPPELQRVLLGQQQALGAGMLGQQAPDGLMVATPAQTLTDTLDDIMAGVLGVRGGGGGGGGSPLMCVWGGSG